ncbi:MAG: PucR family transcriptional regulator, partial [Oscillospiraceae bacterium]
MSNRMFQGVIYQMKDAIGRNVGVTDEMGVVVACSELNQIDSMKDGVQAERMANTQTFQRNGYTYRGFTNTKRNDFYVFVEGTDELADRFSNVLAISLQSLKQFHDEKFDRLNFIKNVVMDNIMPGDIYAKAREMHFSTDIPRVVLIIRVDQQKDMSTFDVVQNLFPDKQKDFVFNASETDTVLIKELKKGIETKDVEKLAASIADTLNVEYYIKATIGIGTQVMSIKDIATSFKEAQIALEVGKVFDTEKTIVNYENLGVARLIYQLPTTLCEMFLKEVFKQ